MKTIEDLQYGALENALPQDIILLSELTDLTSKPYETGNANFWNASKPAVILFTSGVQKKGTPKAIVHSYFSLYRNFLTSNYDKQREIRRLDYFNAGLPAGPIAILQALIKKDLQLIDNYFHIDTLQHVREMNVMIVFKFVRVSHKYSFWFGSRLVTFL